MLRENFWRDPVIGLSGADGSAPAPRVGDPGSNPDPDENFSLKLTTVFFITNNGRRMMSHRYLGIVEVKIL